MEKLLFLIGGQVFLALVLLTHASSPVQKPLSLRNNLPAVLGEEETPSPTDNSTTEPTPTSPPSNDISTPQTISSTDNSTPTPTTVTELTPAPTESAVGTPEPTGITGASEEVTPSPSPAEESGFTDQSNQPASSNQATFNSPTPTLEASASQISVDKQTTTAITNPTEVLANPEAISPQSVAEVSKEEQKLNQTTDPAAQTKVLLDFSKDKVADINNFIKSDDQASVNFASQRFDQQLTRISDNLNNLSGDKAKSLRSQVADFCRQTDLSLKSAQLMVPEEAEQDLEINRARCLNLSQ